MKIGGICWRRGEINIIRVSSFAHKHKLSPHQRPQNSLWSSVTPIMPAKPSLSGPAADLRTPRQQIGLGEGLPQTMEEPPPQAYPLFEINHTGFHIQCLTTPSPCSSLRVCSDSGLGPTPPQSAPTSESHPGQTVPGHEATRPEYSWKSVTHLGSNFIHSENRGVS